MLTGGDILSDNSTIIMLELNTADFDSLKAMTMLAISPASTYISFNYAMIRDMNSNAILPVLPPNLIAVQNFTGDEMGPFITGFFVDMNEGTMTLQFSETVDASTIQLDQFTLQDELFNATTMLTLTGGSSSMIDSTSITITFSFEDLNKLKDLPLCSFDQSGDDCYLIFTEYAINDTSGNQVLEPTEPFNTTLYTPDTTPPFLVNFTEFNYPQETFNLTFSEIVDVSTFDATEITFQTFFSVLNPMSVFTLTGGVINQPNSHTVSVAIIEPDVDAIKAHATLCLR